MSLSSSPIRPCKDVEDTARVRDEPVDSGEPEVERQDGAVDDEAQDDDELQGEEEAGEAPRCLPCPGAPSTADRLAHELTHWPYRQWCEHCVRGRAVGPNARKVPASHREMSVPKAHLDYAYLQDEIIEEKDEFTSGGAVRTSMTILVMLETLCESVWVYTVNAKGVAADKWLPGKIANDLTTVGMGNTRIVVKTDTEPAIVDLRNSLSEARDGIPTGFDDSRVGDSNSNGKIERTIREVK